MWQRAVLCGVAFLILAEAGRFLSVRDSTYISFWLPAGMYVAVLALHETRSWPWLVTGAFAGNLAFDLLHGTPVAAALLFCLANAVQSVLGAWLVRRFVAERPALATLREFVGLMGFAAVLSPIAGAAAGAGILVAFGFSNSFAQSWQVWWGSNAMAILLLSPLILTWFSAVHVKRQRFDQPGRVLEAALIVILMIGLASHLLFMYQGIMSPHKAYLLIPLMWAALRFGPQGATAANLLMAVILAFFTTQFHAGLSPEQVSSGEYVFILQATLVAATLLTLIPAIVLDERDEKMQALRASEERLRQLSRHLIEVEEVQRHTISRELHDRVGQNLSALNLNLGIIRSELPRDSLATAGARLDDSQELLATTSQQVRDVMAELRPAALDDFGLLAALRNHAASVAARLGIAVTVGGKDPDPRLPLVMETTLFRIVQEALNNVSKHAQARNVAVTLEATRHGVRLTVADDGIGFDAGRGPRIAPTYGVITMRERAETIDADLRIESAPGKGTRVVVEVARLPA